MNLLECNPTASQIDEQRRLTASIREVLARDPNRIKEPPAWSLVGVLDVATELERFRRQNPAQNICFLVPAWNINGSGATVVAHVLPPQGRADAVKFVLKWSCE